MKRFRYFLIVMALTSFGFLSASTANESEGAIQAEENLLVRSGAKRELKRTWNRSHCKCPNRDIARNQAHTQESEVANEVVEQKLQSLSVLQSCKLLRLMKSALQRHPMRN